MNIFCKKLLHNLDEADAYFNFWCAKKNLNKTIDFLCPSFICTKDNCEKRNNCRDNCKKDFCDNIKFKC